MRYNLDSDNLPEEIHDVWCWEDVQRVDETLTEKECKQVLLIMKGNLDANVGLNWDVVHAAIEVLRNDLIDDAENN